jgi:hypothetical protein
MQMHSQYKKMRSQCRGPSGHIPLFRMQEILLGIQLISGGIDLSLRSLLVYSQPLSPCFLCIVMWLSIQTHRPMVRLQGIPFGKQPCRRSTTPSLRTRLGIWFHFLQEGSLFRCRWVYRTKSAVDGQVSRYKERLVSKGFQQVHGIDYDETFTLVVKMDSIHLALAIVTTKGWEVHQMDVKNAFLHGDLSEDIYMEQPPGFIQDSSLVCRLKKSLYGLKQASRAWYAKMDSYLLSQNFVRCKYDPNVYMLRTIDSLLILVLYVDDILITGSLTSSISMVKWILHDRFLMMDMGPLHYFLGLEISQDASGIKISQAKYAQDLMERFHMTDCKSSPTPFLSGVRLEDGGDTPLVENTLYNTTCGEFVVSLPLLTRPIICSGSSLQVHAGACMSYTGRMQNVSFGTFGAPSVMGSTMQQVASWIS